MTDKVKDENPASKPTGKSASKSTGKPTAKPPGKSAARKPARKAAAASTEPPEATETASTETASTETAEPETEAATTGKESSGKGSLSKAAEAAKTAKAARTAAKAARDADTATAATHARAVMQRRHRRLGFVMSTAMGIELAGAAGIVIGALLEWEWGERLVGHTGQPWIITQVLLGLALLTLLVAWILRTDRLRVQARIGVVVLATLGAVFAAGLTWQAEFGSRGPGGLVATVGAVLVIAGAVTWLIAMRRLRVLFPFGLADARRTGYGNLPAVRRARLVGGPVGAIGAGAVVAGALLVFPNWLTTIDSETASPVDLTGATPTAGGPPAWQIEVPALAREERSSNVYATPGGPVIEELQGVRGIDPSTGEERWHWRDEAYQRVASALTDGGETVVLALTYEGDDAGRDRVVALDTATGELRWDRYDDELVAAMQTVVVTPDEGDWFVVPEQGEAPADAAQAPPVSLLLVGSDDGRTRWRAPEDQNCRFTDVEAGPTGMVVTTQECTIAEGQSECHVDGLDPASGTEVWTWPPAGAEPAAGCQTGGTAELMFISHEAGEPGADGTAPPTATVALDPRAGTQVWLTDPEAEGGNRGLTNPTVIGDVVLGTEFADDGQGGGHGVMVVREAADGALRTEVDLPAGQPIDVVATGDALAVVPIYAPATGTISLVEFDVAAGAVRSEAAVSADPPETATVQWLAIAVGPESLTIDTLLATGGADGGTPSYVLRVAGW